MSRKKNNEELLKYLQIIYGDVSKLSDRTLKQLENTWKTNPLLIINTANLKTLEATNRNVLSFKRSNAYYDSPEIPIIQRPEINNQKYTTTSVANDDLSNYGDFDEAFGVARKRGLGTFKWKSTKANPSGIFAVLLASPPEDDPKGDPINGSGNGSGDNPVSEEQLKEEYLQYVNRVNNADSISNVIYSNTGTTPNTLVMTKFFNDDVRKDLGGSTWLNQSWNSLLKNGPIITDYNLVYKPIKPKTYEDWLKTEAPKPADLVPTDKNGGIMNKYQLGGSTSLQEELQKAFMAYLIQDAAEQGIEITTEQELESYAQLLGEDGIKAKYLEFLLKMLGQTLIARLGAKLNYYKLIKGDCPEGQELVFFKRGGKTCKACQKKKNGAALKEPKKGNAVSEFKKTRKAQEGTKTKKLVEKPKLKINENDTVHVMINGVQTPHTLTDWLGKPIVSGMPIYGGNVYYKDAHSIQTDPSAYRRVIKADTRSESGAVDRYYLNKKK